MSMLKLSMGVCVSWLLDARSWEAQLALNLLCKRDWSQTSALSCFVSIHHVCGVCSFMLSWYWFLMAAHQFTVDWISLWIIFIVEKGHFNNLYNFINTSKMCLSFPVTCTLIETSLLDSKTRQCSCVGLENQQPTVQSLGTQEWREKCFSLQRQESYIPKRSKLKNCLYL